MKTYTASLDTVSKILTGFLFLMMTGGILMSFIFAPFYGGLIVSVTPAILIACFYPYRVVAYQITDKALIIERPFAKLNKEIPLSEIESVSIPDKSDFKWTIRTFGDGGLFGYYGLFANPKLGSFRAYATQRSNRILIVLKAKEDKIVITPDDAEMADILQKRLKAQSKIE